MKRPLIQEIRFSYWIFCRLNLKCLGET